MVMGCRGAEGEGRNLNVSRLSKEETVAGRSQETCGFCLVASSPVKPFFQVDGGIGTLS